MVPGEETAGAKALWQDILGRVRILQEGTGSWRQEKEVDEVRPFGDFGGQGEDFVTSVSDFCFMKLTLAVGCGCNLSTWEWEAGELL